MQKYRHGKRKGKGHRKANKRAAQELVRLAETKQRSAAISSYLDMIPARLYLGIDNEHIAAQTPGYDPAEAKSTSQIIAIAAQAEIVKAEEAAKERMANAPQEALAPGERGAVSKSGKLLSKSQARRAAKLKSHTADGVKKGPAIDPMNRKQLSEKLHKRIAELKEQKRTMQADRDRANMALRQAGPVVPAESKPPKVTAPTKVKKRAIETPEIKDEAEVGRLNFEATTASLPFRAQVLKKKGGKAARIQEDMRKNEIEQKKVRKAEAAGKGDEVKKDIAMEKALKRARGEEVHDDPARLRKAQRRLDVQHKKSAKKWKKRIEAVTEGIEAQQAKRKENLSKTRGKKQFAALERMQFKKENEEASANQ